MIILSVTEGVKAARTSFCQNRLELIVDPGMDSDAIRRWAHMAVDNWLTIRMDLTSPRGYDSGQRGDHET